MDEHGLSRPARPLSPWPWLASLGLVVLTVVLLKIEGRVWWCECRAVRPWVSDVWSNHCSQHLLDPYSITHISHGLIFFGVMALLWPRSRMAWRLAAAIAITASWEVLENSPWVIDRYRETTMSQDYLGDSAVNATGDILSCVAGFYIARAVGLLWSVGIFVATEVGLLFVMRDNLTLNVVMLLYPVEAIKTWQSAGQPGAG
ncbi:MAG: DUF2585 family protein [Phycisphaerales bacterium]